MHDSETPIVYSSVGSTTVGGILSNDWPLRLPFQSHFTCTDGRNNDHIRENRDTAVVKIW